jgi:hypothetical protein
MCVSWESRSASTCWLNLSGKFMLVWLDGCGLVQVRQIAHVSTMSLMRSMTSSDTPMRCRNRFIVRVEACHHRTCNLRKTARAACGVAFRKTWIERLTSKDDQSRPPSAGPGGMGPAALEEEAPRPLSEARRSAATMSGSSSSCNGIVRLCLVVGGVVSRAGAMMSCSCRVARSPSFSGSPAVGSVCAGSFRSTGRLRGPGPSGRSLHSLPLWLLCSRGSFSQQPRQTLPRCEAGVNRHSPSFLRCRVSVFGLHSQQAGHTGIHDSSYG